MERVQLVNHNVRKIARRPLTRVQWRWRALFCHNESNEVFQLTDEAEIAAQRKLEDAFEVTGVPRYEEAYEQRKLMHNGPLDRALLWHPESECLFEVHGEKKILESLATGEVENVTGMPEYETEFKIQEQGR